MSGYSALTVGARIRIVKSNPDGTPMNAIGTITSKANGYLQVRTKGGGEMRLRAKEIETVEEEEAAEEEEEGGDGGGGRV